LLEQKQKEMDKIDAENKIKIKKFNKEIDDEIEMFKTLTQWRKDDSTRKKNTLFNKQIQITYIRITEKINEISKLFIEILEIIKENYFKKNTVKTTLTEENYSIDEPGREVVYTDPSIRSYAQAISRTIKK